MTRKNAITTSVVIIVVIVAGILIAAYNHHKNNEMSMSQTGSSTQTAPSPTPSASPTPTPKANLSYANAIKAYPERFQFSQCQGTPATIAVRKGTPVMLDNRSSTAITIKADTDTFRLAGYGYDVFYPEVIENVTVTCNGKNSVTLNVEQ